MKVIHIRQLKKKNYKKNERFKQKTVWRIKDIHEIFNWLYKYHLIQSMSIFCFHFNAKRKLAKWMIAIAIVVT